MSTVLNSIPGHMHMTPPNPHVFPYSALKSSSRSSKKTGPCLTGKQSSKYIWAVFKAPLGWWFNETRIWINRDVKYYRKKLKNTYLDMLISLLNYPILMNIICIYIYWLVVWNMFYVSIQLGKIIPTDFHSIIFQRGRYTTNHLYPSHHPYFTGIFHYKPSISSIYRWG